MKAGLKTNKIPFISMTILVLSLTGAIMQINNDYNALEGAENVKSRPIFNTFGIFDKEI